MVRTRFDFYRRLSPALVLGAILVWASQIHAAPPVKRALLIGIDDYKAASVPDLRGAVNDVELMRGILIGKFDTAPENVTVLTNDAATRAGIINAIQTELVAKAQPGDVVIVHYSGHGSQMKDVSGDEIDGMDETLVPHDSRTEGVFDINDDEINGLLAQLAAKTRNVTFIFDSCHSGSATRAGNTVRMIAPDDREPPPAEAFARGTRGAGEGEADIRLEGSDYVLISGSLATELSNEADFEGRRHGAMTWFLAQALRLAGATSTYRDVMDDVRSEVNNRYPSQHPQIEGKGLDLVVFGSDRVNALPYVLVDPLDAQTVRVDGGKVYGLREGTLLKVYPPRTGDFDSTPPAATIEISEVDDFEARATVREGGAVAPRSRAVLEAFMYGDTAIPLHVRTAGVEALEKIKQMLASFPALRLVDEEKDARIIVAAGDGEIVIESGDLELLVPPVSVSDAKRVERVVDQVKDLVHWLSVMDLKSPNRAIDVGFDIRRQGDPPGAASPVDVGPGARLSYRVHNRDAIPLYVYVLDVSSDGSIALLYPNVAGAQEQLAPGKTLEKTIETFLPEGHRAVVDVLKVIATTNPIDPSVFPQGAFRGAPPASTRAVQDPLARFLAGSLRSGTRGARPVEVKSWVTAQKSITIRQPGVRFSGFALHFDDARAAADLPAGFGAARSACTDAAGPGDCFEKKRISQDGRVWELIQRKAARGGADPLRSVGEAFEEAYAIQDQIPGAKRVEPMLDVQVPGVVDQRGIEKREILSDDAHDPAAEGDDQWHLKQIRAAEAWRMIRDARGVGAGAEADGMLVAHTDTGYRDHPETWAEVAGKRPIDPAKGYDYFEDDNDPTDPLLEDLPLDNPGHGTAAGSVIVSPAGCQLANAAGCVHGIDRGAQLVPLRVHRTVSQFNSSNLSRAIRDVAEGSVAGQPKLVSIAMGGPPTFTMWNAVRAAEKNGVLIVAAAGNYVRTVVWPARFRSTVAVAAVNVRCRPWKHSSRGGSVDVSAPGESVWRATLNAQHQYINGMGKGTTFATGNTSGAVALWLAWHRDDPKLADLRQQGRLTQALRAALRASAWRPAADPADNPQGTSCDTSAWDASDYGPGILDVAALLNAPLDAPGTRALAADEPEDLPLFASLYPESTDAERIRADYRALFGETRADEAEKMAKFETEILYHYTVDEAVQRTLDGVVRGQRAAEPYALAREALLRKDLSSRLRSALK